MKGLELLVERIIISSRWLLVIFYIGLAVALGIYAISFGYKLAKVALSIFSADESDMILSMLSLIDAALVASLIVMVMISGYENFVSRFDEAEKNGEISFLGKLDSGSLKIKVASSIVAISSIHLLQVFLNADRYDGGKLLWLTVIHLTFVGSAVMLGYLETLMRRARSDRPGSSSIGPS
ncbi:TIGR00645 family protein [Rhizobium sp. RU35A]|uniref:TIGR00645 family protein n=1 Tax=Rhizobium sp. RU35A TaxID=1907414 RepID=UPI000953A976|nr:TIGR00645 family protein [Rhizobium sp. RU35A]SIR40325.1 TIGR00645 family protein [Rhizobium sp. RU35A]